MRRPPTEPVVLPQRSVDVLTRLLPIEPVVFPQRSVEVLTRWLPMYPVVLPQRSVEVLTRLFPMYPVVLPQRSVEVLTRCPSQYPVVLPQRSVEVLQAACAGAERPTSPASRADTTKVRLIICFPRSMPSQYRKGHLSGSVLLANPLSNFVGRRDIAQRDVPDLFPMRLEARRTGTRRRPNCGDISPWDWWSRLGESNPRPSHYE